MVSIVIAMLLVLVIYQIYEVSEGQKRTITAGSDAQQNASYGLFVLTRDRRRRATASCRRHRRRGTAILDGCAMLRPIPALIAAGATDNDPDTVTVLYGGSSSLATPVQFKQTATTAQPYVVPGPVGFSAEGRDRGRPGRKLHALHDQRQRGRSRRHDRLRDAFPHADRRHHGRHVLRGERLARQSGAARVDGSHRLFG